MIEVLTPKTIIIGHKNPDTDSIVSARAYTELKKILGMQNVIAGRTGFPNAKTEFLFKKFNVELPELINDVEPTVGDVLNKNHISITQDRSLFDAIKMFQKYHIFRMPVVDTENKYIGMISLFDVTNKMLTTHDDQKKIINILDRKVTTSINLAAKTLKAEAINIYDDQKMEDLYVYVAAQGLISFRNHVLQDPQHLAIVVGDREDIQYMAIEVGIRLLIITNKAKISEEFIQMAKKKNISILRTHLDSASSVRMLKFSVPVNCMMQTESSTFSISDKLLDIKHEILSSLDDTFPVIGGEKKLLGTISKNDMDESTRTQLILVDHNNLKQAVDGASELPIVEIVDHHNINYPIINHPISVTNDIVGSTCTLITEKYVQNNVTPPKDIAGILMGAIIDDTLFLKSPTSTLRDKKMIEYLESISEVNAKDLANEIFNIGSVISSNPPEKVILGDKKNYSVGNFHYAVSQVEELSFNSFETHFEELLLKAKEIAEKEKLSLLALIVTNLTKETSRMLVAGENKFFKLIPFHKIKDNLYDLPGIMSRKKQIIPMLMKSFQSAEKH